VHSLLATPWRRLAVVLVAFALGLFALTPVLWMFGTAFKPVAETYSSPPTWLPRHPTLTSFAYIMERAPFLLYLRNSLIVALATTLLALLVSIPASYAFSRYSFPGRRSLLLAILGTQMFPAVLLIIPLFQVIGAFGLLNTLGALILADVTFALPLCIWLLKGFLDQVPRELDEAAMLDGCVLAATLGRVVLPVAAPGLAATAIFTFIGAWDEFVFALTFTSQDAARTLPVGLSLFISSYEIQWNHLGAMALLVTVPVLALFFLIQRYMVSGALAGSLKE